MKSFLVLFVIFHLQIIAGAPIDDDISANDGEDAYLEEGHAVVPAISKYGDNDRHAVPPIITQFNHEETDHAVVPIINEKEDRHVVPPIVTKIDFRDEDDASVPILESDTELNTFESDHCISPPILMQFNHDGSEHVVVPRIALPYYYTNYADRLSSEQKSSRYNVPPIITQFNHETENYLEVPKILDGNLNAIDSTEDHRFVVPPILILYENEDQEHIVIPRIPIIYYPDYFYESDNAKPERTNVPTIITQFTHEVEEFLVVPTIPDDKPNEVDRFIVPPILTLYDNDDLYHVAVPRIPIIYYPNYESNGEQYVPLITTQFKHEAEDGEPIRARKGEISVVPPIFAQFVHEVESAVVPDISKYRRSTSTDKHYVNIPEIPIIYFTSNKDTNFNKRTDNLDENNSSNPTTQTSIRKIEKLINKYNPTFSMLTGLTSIDVINDILKLVQDREDSDWPKNFIETSNATIDNRVKIIKLVVEEIGKYATQIISSTETQSAEYSPTSG